MRFFEVFRNRTLKNLNFKGHLVKEATIIFMGIVPRVSGMVIGERPRAGWPFDLVVPPLECYLTFECPDPKVGLHGPCPQSDRIFFPSEESVIKAGEIFASECLLPIRITIWLPRKRLIDPQPGGPKVEFPSFTFETGSFAQVDAEAKSIIYRWTRGWSEPFRGANLYKGT